MYGHCALLDALLQPDRARFYACETLRAMEVRFAGPDATDLAHLCRGVRLIAESALTRDLSHKSL
jgi:hypothetical protein